METIVSNELQKIGATIKKIGCSLEDSQVEDGDRPYEIPAEDYDYLILVASKIGNLMARLKPAATDK